MDLQIKLTEEELDHALRVIASAHTEPKPGRTYIQFVKDKIDYLEIAQVARVHAEHAAEKVDFSSFQASLVFSYEKRMTQNGEVEIPCCYILDRWNFSMGEQGGNFGDVSTSGLKAKTGIIGIYSDNGGFVLTKRFHTDPLIDLSANQGDFDKVRDDLEKKVSEPIQTTIRHLRAAYYETPR